VNIILFGPPGAGKGTQAQNIIKKFNLLQISTGDLLRKEISNKTITGKQIEQIINRGDFVNDNIVNDLLKKVITTDLYRNKIIFDGYPRNINQAKSLEVMLSKDSQSIDYVLFLKVNKVIVEKRILGRIVCEKCNKTLNEYFDTEELENHECGSKFFKKRKDDNQQTIINRYDEYMKQTKPVLDFYSSIKNFHEIDGSQKIDEITRKIEQILRV
tara:strand:+ start:602 stop:1243 length:642 start_codon:yes stop_codon:yes gene_type:complete